MRPTRSVSGHGPSNSRSPPRSLCESTEAVGPLSIRASSLAIRVHVREREKEGERERASEKRGGDKEGESTTRTATKERHGEEWEEREGKSTAAFFYERFDAVSRMEKALARL